MASFLPPHLVYHLTITDDFTCWCFLKLLTNKCEESIQEAFKEYKGGQHSVCRLVAIKDNRGAEFIGNWITAWRQEHGIQT